MVAMLAIYQDTALMIAVSHGDQASFDLLLNRHRNSVVSHLYRLVQNHAIAEELAQDVFIRVYRSRAKYQPDAKFTTWLFRITTNVALNWRRDTRREPTNCCCWSIAPNSSERPSIYCRPSNSPPFSCTNTKVWNTPRSPRYWN